MKAVCFLHNLKSADLVRYREQRMIKQCQFYDTVISISSYLITWFILLSSLGNRNNVIHSIIWKIWGNLNLNLFDFDPDNQGEPCFRLIVHFDVKCWNTFWNWCFHHVMEVKVHLFMLLSLCVFMSDIDLELAASLVLYLQTRFFQGHNISGLLPTRHTISVKSIKTTVKF